MTSQAISKEIRSAIKKWYQTSGKTQCELANILGLPSQSVLNSWLNGPAKSIRASKWSALYPHIRAYLPEDFDPAEAQTMPVRSRTDPLLAELQKLWPQLSLSEKSRVLTFTAELLEKQSGHLQPEILEKAN